MVKLRVVQTQKYYDLKKKHEIHKRTKNALDYIANAGVWRITREARSNYAAFDLDRPAAVCTRRSVNSFFLRTALPTARLLMVTMLGEGNEQIEAIVQRAHALSFRS